MAKKTGNRRPKGAAVPRIAADIQAAAPENIPDQPLEDAIPFIVCVGASAGGLDSFTELLHHLPADTGMTFVLIQHLDPRHESHLTELLAKATLMPVSEVKIETRVQANHIYVIPPRRNLGILGGVLHPQPRASQGPNMPIDVFLRALAADRGIHAAGVILSGNASDGTQGLRALKAAGGITFAQEIRSAKFREMPANAIAAGAVDFVLPVTGIARKLAAMAGDFRLAVDAEPAEPPANPELARVLRLVRAATGLDFTHYKHGTLLRRIKRRMGLRGFDRVENYCGELERNREEAHALCESFFITVTAFFRDPAVFEELRTIVLPELIAARLADDPMRIWVAGCSTGEEAYSIAICLTESLEAAGVNLPREIFATDICGPAIERARSGIYPASALANMSPQRLAKFFTKSERGYQIAKSIRDQCVFARHDVAQDPPFSRLDLISCSNVMIYLGTELQRKVLSILHYALKPTGFLMLGPSESAGSQSNSFHHLEKTNRIYRTVAGAAATALPVSGSRPVKGLTGFLAATVEDRSGLHVQREADRLMMAEHNQPGVLIDSQMNIIQIRGRTSLYLEFSPGEPTYNLLSLAREGLLAGLRKAIRAARETNAIATESGFRLEDGGRLRDVAIKVIPCGGLQAGQERCFLILFEDIERGAGRAAKRPRAAKASGETSRLRDELVATKEYLQSIVEGNAATLEEVQAANEEAQASNEELETAQEELESANEELNTLNDELKTNNIEFSKVNRDLTNLLESISIPLVMVGRDLRIRRFTRAIEPMLSLIASDVGRSITDLQPQMELPDLRRLLLDAMESGNRKPRDVRDSHGRWYSLRILPSLGPDGKTDGAVLMLIDVDAAKRGLDFAEAIVETVREPLVILSQGLHVVKANKAFYEVFKAAPVETEGRLIYDLGNGQWNIPRLRELLEGILPAHATFRDFEVTHEFEHVGRKIMLLNASEIFNPNAQSRTILLAIEDATDRKLAEEALRATNAELQHFAYALTHDLQEPLRMVVNFTELLGEEYSGKLDEGADQYIAYSVEGALRIEALLKALLGYWEVTERQQDTFASLDCNAVLAKSLLNLQAAIAESGAVITHDPLPTVVAEEVLLTQLFQNLISNSIKYRSEEAPRIHVSAERDLHGWELTVRDNGIGIDPRDSSRVFGMFKRLHGSEIPGTGIGLALCKKLVERQGGRIWIESETGRGAKFHFTIPSARRLTRAANSD